MTMYNPQRHNIVLTQILIEMYKNSIVHSVLGFKGGTAAMLFYGLPRFSVDLDFDLLNISQQSEVFGAVKKLVSSFGRIIESGEKRYTLFYLLSYEKGQRNLKVEISKRPHITQYEVKEYLGVPMLVMSQTDMAASKLAALMTRNNFAARDMFDVWYFLKHNWKLNEVTVQHKTGCSIHEAVEKAITRVSRITKSEQLSGLGELLNAKQKDWARNHLQEELILQLKIYAKSLK